MLQQHHRHPYFLLELLPLVLQQTRQMQYLLIQQLQFQMIQATLLQQYQQMPLLILQQQLRFQLLQLLMLRVFHNCNLLCIQNIQHLHYKLHLVFSLHNRLDHHLMKPEFLKLPLQAPQVVVHQHKFQNHLLHLPFG